MAVALHRREEDARDARQEAGEHHQLFVFARAAHHPPREDRAGGHRDAVRHDVGACVCARKRQSVSY